MKVDPQWHNYYECQKDICNKEKLRETQAMDELLKNLNDTKHPCDIASKNIQKKFDMQFLQKQQLLVMKTLGRNYLQKSDLKHLKGVIDNSLLNNKDFLTLLKCREKYSLAKYKKDRCVRKKCGKDPFTKGGRRTRKQRRKTRTRKSRRRY